MRGCPRKPAHPCLRSRRGLVAGCSDKESVCGRGTDTCAVLGCREYDDRLPCQCDEWCEDHYNCCRDKESVCGWAAEKPVEK